MFSRFFGILGVIAFVAVAGTSMAATQDAKFQSWVGKLKSEARSKGISDRTINLALSHDLKPIPRIIELDRKQPEGTKTYAEYLNQVVSEKRVSQGRTRILNNGMTLDKVMRHYPIEKEVVVALWGIETNYGSNTGGFGIIPALATLAYDGRRSDYFRGELFKALKIVDEGHIALSDFTGSWAGAMGQVQFMPSSFYNFAEDFNKDGRRDIWGTQSDIFASAANYLVKSGWKKGQPWGRAVTLPANFNRNLLGTDNKHNLQFWQDQGVRGANGRPLPFEGAQTGSIIQPDGANTAAYIVYENYRVILKWNRSNYFATAVGLLSDRLKGG